MSAPSRPVRLPLFFVSARHGTLARGDQGASGWQPFGVQHARMVGGRFTACGLPAATWRIFWEQPFPNVSDSTCQECVVAVAFDEQRPRLVNDLTGGAR
jgi:hypothetical protein